MTNREEKIQGLRNTWAALLTREEELVHELWTIKNQKDKINETLRKYGQQEIQPMAQSTTTVATHCGNDCSVCRDAIRNECDYYKLHSNQ